jgi:hypothetical protein
VSKNRHSVLTDYLNLVAKRSFDNGFRSRDGATVPYVQIVARVSSESFEYAGLLSSLASDLSYIAYH